MRKLALPLAAGLMLFAIVLGAIACSDDDDDNGNGESPTATEEMADETPGDGDETPAAGAVGVRLLEFQLVPDPESAAAGEVTFEAENIGAAEHELAVLRTDLAPDALPAVEDGSVDEAGEDVELIGEIEGIAAGGSDSTTLALEAGSYVLICNIVEEDGTSHYVEGMHAAFTVN